VSTFKPGRLPDDFLQDDEGALAAAIAWNDRHKVVYIEFEKSVRWVALPPEQAREFANLILRKLKEHAQ
jgi:hypothetical protein